MAVAQQIQESVQRLPTAFQAEVLHFVEYLLAKAEREALQQEEQEWSSISLATAMRDAEDVDDPQYTASDVKVVF
jgi:alkylhydroperoxidase/carboxymuconolactone decarboxylase family protein YurZ